MKFVIYTLFVTVFLVDYLQHDWGIGSRYITWVPDILSGIALLMVALEIAAKKSLILHPKYLIIIFLLVFHAFAGVILNSVQSGAVFSGVRIYFKYLPFFLVPAVFVFSDKEMTAQLKFLLGVALLQFPLVVYQRFVQFSGVKSGDPISGTMLISSILSIYLISTIAILLAVYLKKKIGVVEFCILLAILFLPTTLNETKGTLFLLPIALVIPLIMFMKEKKKLAAVGPVLLLGIVLMGAFVKIYNFQTGQEMGGNELSSFFEEDQYKRYLYKDSSGGLDEGVGKFDSFFIAIKVLSENFTKMAFGLGIGNVHKTFSNTLSGEYLGKFDNFSPSKTAFSYMIWELGVIWVALMLVFCYMIFSDARYLSKHDNIAGTLALGWSAVAVIYVVALSYKNILIHNVIGYPFWYLSGYIAASRLRWEWEKTLHQ